MTSPSVPSALRDLRNVKNAGVRFVDPKGAIRRISYSDLIESASRFAGGLLRCGVVRGEPVILVMTDPQSAIIAILGCMILGCPPTPVYPPMNLNGIPSFLNFLKHVAERSGATFVVADPQPYAFLGNVPREAPPVRGVEKFNNVSGLSSVEFSDPGHSTAFLQFTSGSTSVPKGVMVTQEGLMENLRMIREASHMDGNSCVVTWLPVYHDMGLIGTVLNAITLPCELVVLPPMLFLKRPRLWLELITQFRGTHTAAPNFAYGLLTRRVGDVSGLDLGSMTTFICGAEPVIPRTMETFVEHFRSAGLHPGAMVPAYGLAEATLAVTFSPHLRGLAADEVDLELLTEGREALPAALSGKAAIRVSSCGVPMKGMELRIASQEGFPLPDRRIGEVQVRGVCVTPGYIGDDEASRSSRTADGWFRTGDLGYLKDGELHPCGRMKDVIIVRGRNYHAHDLESTASEVPGVRTGNVVAFSIPSAGGESLVIVAETRSEEKTNELSRAIRAHVAESMGITPDEVLVVGAGTLPKTSSGKLKRNETRRLFQEDRLGMRSGTISALGVAVKSGIGHLKNRLRGNSP